MQGSGQGRVIDTVPLCGIVFDARRIIGNTDSQQPGDDEQQQNVAHENAPKKQGHPPGSDLESRKANFTAS